MIRYIIIAAAMWTTSCTASSLELHARAAYTSHSVLAEAQRTIRAEHLREANAAEASEEYREDAAAAVAVVSARWAPIVEAYEAARAIHATWIAAISHAASGRPFDVTLAVGLARQLVQAFHELRLLAERVGLEFGDLGTIVNAALSAEEES